jgi:hypothetical protein
MGLLGSESVHARFISLLGLLKLVRGRGEEGVAPAFLNLLMLPRHSFLRFA